MLAIMAYGLWWMGHEPWTWNKKIIFASHNPWDPCPSNMRSYRESYYYVGTSGVIARNYGESKSSLPSLIFVYALMLFLWLPMGCRKFPKAFHKGPTCNVGGIHLAAWNRWDCKQGICEKSTNIKHIVHFYWPTSKSIKITLVVL